MKRFYLIFSLLITLTFCIEGMYAAVYESYTENTMTEGDYIIVAQKTSDSKYYAMNNTCTNNQYMGIEEVTVTNGKITTDATNIVWTISSNSGGFTIANGNNYLDDNATSNKNYVRLVATSSSGTSIWAFAYSNSKWSITNSGTTTTKKTLSFNMNSTRVACYASAQSGANQIYLYKKSGESSDPTISAAPSEVKDIAATGVSNQTIDLTYENISDYETEVTVHSNADGTGTLSPAWLTVSVSDADDYATITYSVSANDGAARTAYIKVYATDGDKEAETIIPVSQVKYSAPTGTFELFSGDIAEGDYVIVSTNALSNTVNSNRIASQAVTISNNKIVNPDAAVVWHIEKDGDYWTVYNAEAEKYAGGTSTKNQGALLASVTNYAKWTITGSSTYEFENLGRAVGSSDTGNKWLRYNSGNSENSRWACYSTSTGSALTLYKKSDGKPTAPTFSPEGGAYLDAQSVTISAATGTSIYYTTDGSTPTTSSTLYTDAIPVSTTTIIKAIAVKDEVSSNAATSTYTIITPLTVAEAIALIPNANDQVNDQYVEGYVCTAGTSVLSGGKMTYYISADGSETNRLQIYKGKNLNDTEFSATSDLAIGDKVVVFGQLKNYSGTKEMNDGNYIARYTAKGALQSVAVSGTPTKTAYSSGDAFEPAGLTVTATYTSGYAINVASELTASAWTASPATVTAEGDISVTATYGGKTSAAYAVHVTVLAATLESISLSYDAVDVYQGKDLPKPTVTAHWSDASTSDVTALATFTGYNKNTTGGQTITVSYEFGSSGSKEATYTVTVKPIFNTELNVADALDIITTVIGNTESTGNMVVRGIVSRANNASNNVQTYWISDDGETTSELEIFKGKYLEGANFTTSNQLKAGDEVVVTGKVTYYSNTTAEFSQGSQLTELAHPEVAVTSVTMGATASVEVGATVTLTATVSPDNASNKSITWTVESGSDYASVADGTVTGIAAGTAVIRATSVADGTKYAECIVTVTAVDPNAQKVTFDATVDMGESPLSKSNITMTCSNGALNNGSEYRLYKNSKTTFACSAGNITKIEFTGVSGNPVSGFGAPEVGSLATDGNDGVWTGNATSVAFTASGAQVRATKIVVTYSEDNREVAGLSWNPTSVTLTVGETFTAAALQNPKNIAANEIAIASDNENLATVNAGVVSLVPDATGTATITATFAGNATYKPAEVSYTITVNPASTPSSGALYMKITSTDELTDGEYILVYEDNATAYVYTGVDAAGNYVKAAISANKANLPDGAATLSIAAMTGGYSIMVNGGTNDGKYMSGTSESNTTNFTADAVANTITFNEGNAEITAGGKIAFNSSANNLRFRYFKSNQGAVQLYKKESAQPAYTEVRNELTAGWYYTMCLDKAVTAVQGASIWRVISKSDNSEHPGIILEEVTGTLDAGRPYFFYATADKLKVIYNGSAVGAPLTEGNNGLVGSFEKTKLAQSDDHYILYDNELYYVNSNNVYVGANRAYLDMTGVPAYNDQSGSAPGRRRVTMNVHGKEVAAGVDAVSASDKPMKVMIDGQLFILRGEKMYDATGRLVK